MLRKATHLFGLTKASKLRDCVCLGFRSCMHVCHGLTTCNLISITSTPYALATSQPSFATPFSTYY